MDWDKAFDHYQHAIASKDEHVQIQFTIKLARFSRYVPEEVLVRAIPLVIELLGSPVSDHSPSIHEVSSYCLKCIACEGDGRLAAAIGQSGAIPLLLRLLRDSGGRSQKVMLKCIRNIMMFEASNRTIVDRNGGLEIIIDLLNSNPDNSSRQHLLENFSYLSLLREVRRKVYRTGAVSLLVESARCGSMISRTRAAQAIGLLGLIKRARVTIFASGALPVLLELIRDGDDMAKLVAGNALGVISSHVDYIRSVAHAGAIPLYSELLQGSNPLGKEIAEDVFCILAVADENALTIIEQLMNILRGGDDESKAAAADVLWNLSGYVHLSPILQNSGVIQLLASLLTYRNNHVREKVSGAIAQLSYHEAVRQILSDSGAIPLLIDMLEDESDELKDNAAEALANYLGDPLLGDRISNALGRLSFNNMVERLTRIRSSITQLTPGDLSLEHLYSRAGLS
ncbi:hypothetical protein LIER_05259 [Lithospermum erythrorhizon]|uniref:Uncharacterized protein n=1 Tax=Lithospermum erythrorhizon TaxID=34254 RepID=A0AAV3NZW5_LITER